MDLSNVPVAGKQPTVRLPDTLGYHLEQGDDDVLGAVKNKNMSLGLDPSLVKWPDQLVAAPAAQALGLVVDLLPDQFTAARKACLKEEKLPAIKAAVVQTMNDDMLLARPFHVYNKHAPARKPWPPHVLTMRGATRKTW